MHSRDEKINSSPSHSLAIVSSFYVLQLYYNELLLISLFVSSRDAGGILANSRRKMKTRFTNGDKFGFTCTHIFFFFFLFSFQFFFFSFFFFLLSLHSIVQQWFLAKRSRVSKCLHIYIYESVPIFRPIKALLPLGHCDFMIYNCLNCLFLMSPRLGNKFIFISSNWDYVVSLSSALEQSAINLSNK